MSFFLNKIICNLINLEFNLIYLKVFYYSLKVPLGIQKNNNLQLVNHMVDVYLYITIYYYNFV